MADKASWRIFLSKSPAPGTDPSIPLQRIAWLRDADDMTLSAAVNRGGEVGFSYPMTSTQRGREFHQMVIPYLFSGVDYCIEAERNKQVEWSGPLANNSGSTTTLRGGRTSVKAVGWRELLTVIDLREDLTYGPLNGSTGLPWKDWEIVRDLLATVINYDPAHAPPLRFGDHFGTPQYRQMSWPKGTNIDQCFRDLEELEAGIDVVVDPNTRLINTYAWDVYQDHPELVFGFGRPPFNIATFGWRVDFMKIRNDLIATGDGIIPGQQVDGVSQDRFGRFEETVALSGVKKTDTLVAYVAEEVALRAFPVRFYEFTPMQASGRKSVPVLFDNFSIGDGCRMSVKYGPFDIIDQKVRAFAVDLSMPRDGGERITKFQTSFAEGG